MISVPHTAFILLTLSLIISTQSAISHLTDKTFEHKVNSTSFALVYFYSSSCKFCKEFTPKFQKISRASQLIHLNITFGKIDSPLYQNFTRQYDVYTYPTIALFTQGISLPVIYRRERQQKQLIDFILKTVKAADQPKLLEVINKISSQEILQNKYALFRGKSDSIQFKAWDIIAKRDEYISWAFIEDQLTKLIIGDNQFSDFSNLNQLQQKVEAVYARLNYITEQSWKKMIDRKKFSIVYINKYGNKKTRQLLIKIAKDVPNVNFVEVDGEDENYKEALKYLGINDQENIISVDKLYDAIYIASSPYTESGLKQFIEMAKAHKLDLYRKSQKSDKPNKLTRNNYEQKMSTKQDVLLFLYDRSQQISKELMNLFQFLLLKLKNNKNLLLLRCDIKLNEVEQKLGFVIKNTPRLIFFRNKMKDYPIHFAGQTISAQSVIEFIMENTTFDFQDDWAQL